MKIAIAQIWQETHTFCSNPTGLREFQQGGLFYGDEIIEKMRGLGEMGGFLEALEGVGLVPILRAWAMSGGRVTAEALESFEASLISGLEANLPLDGVLLSMHGASASEVIDDLEGYLLAAARRVVGKDTPIVVTLDHHANITQQIVESVDGLIGYQLLPHDPYETGLRGAQMLRAIIRGEIQPKIGWRKIPMLAPADRGKTDEYPMQAWFGLAREMERRAGVVSVSNFPVQPWLDVPELGWSVVAVADGDSQAADALAAELAQKAWELRDEFWKVRRVSPQEAIRSAVQAPAGPVIICDASDSVLSGVPGDSTCLLEEMLRQQMPCMALLPMVDPQVVEQAIAAGQGAEIEAGIGGKLDPVFGKTLRIRGRVGGIVEEGMVFTLGKLGASDMGRCALLELGNVRVVVSENRGIGGTNPDIYRRFGIEPAQAKMIVVKTYFNYQMFAPFYTDVIWADCPGLSGWDLRKFKWEKAPRPVYPLDEVGDWRA